MELREFIADTFLNLNRKGFCEIKYPTGAAINQQVRLEKEQKLFITFIRVKFWQIKCFCVNFKIFILFKNSQFFKNKKIILCFCMACMLHLGADANQSCPLMVLHLLSGVLLHSEHLVAPVPPHLINNPAQNIYNQVFRIPSVVSLPE